MPSIIPGSGLMADSEFRLEVKQSLERAFSEGHSVENAAVELKTLRMASNVPLSRVKEAVVAAIVEKIPIVDGDPAVQRREIAAVVGRWGDLINRIGGVDPIETVCILQVDPECTWGDIRSLIVVPGSLRNVNANASVWTNSSSFISRRYC